MNLRKYSSAALAMAFCLMASNSLAKIPEPDNIIYGVSREDAVVLSLKVAGREIAAYTMGSSEIAGDYYILRIPIDSIDPQEDGTARPGETAEIFINGETTPAASVIIGAKGSIIKLHLATADADSDGIIDIIEEENGTNPYNPDTDGDSLSDNNESGSDPLKFDTDGDGYSDGYEKAANTDPDNELDFPAIYVDGASGSGLEDGSRANPYKTIGAAITAAPSKYTVLVAQGVYTETLTFDKELKLVGVSPRLTVIDGGNQANVINYSADIAGVSSIEKFIIRNADVGINLAGGASPLIRNNVITEINTTAILCGSGSAARIINNTISNNSGAVAVSTESENISAVNNIISGNDNGFTCLNGVTTPRLAFNDLWNNTTAYSACLPGSGDKNFQPGFVAAEQFDFRLAEGSKCIDGGDPVETLSRDFDPDEASIDLVDVTNIADGDRVWLSDGTNTETDFVTAVTENSITISGKFMNSFSSSNSYLFTETSLAVNENEDDSDNIDLGAFGNTPEAGGYAIVLFGDSDQDGDVDGIDIQKFITGSFTTTDLNDFAGNFGR